MGGSLNHQVAVFFGGFESTESTNLPLVESGKGVCKVDATVAVTLR